MGAKKVWDLRSEDLHESGTSGHHDIDCVTLFKMLEPKTWPCRSCANNRPCARHRMRNHGVRWVPPSSGDLRDTAGDNL